MLLETLLSLGRSGLACASISRTHNGKAGTNPGFSSDTVWGTVSLLFQRFDIANATGQLVAGADRDRIEVEIDGDVPRPCGGHAFIG